MNDPKTFLMRIGALDALTMVLLGFAVPILQISLYPKSIIPEILPELLTPKRVLLIILSIFFRVLIELAILFLVAKGYTIGMVLKSFDNLFFGFCCFLALRMVVLLLSPANTMFRSKAWIYILLSVFCGLHFAFSAYFQYTAACNKSVRAYLSEVKRNRVRKSSD